MYRKMMTALGIVALAVGIGCAKVPQNEIDTAKGALEKARSAEAPEYAPAAWELAQGALDSAMAEVQAQNHKFILLRSYGTAGQLLDKATQSANAAATEATDARDEAKKQAMTRIEEAQTALDAATKALETAPKGKGTQADLAQMKAEIEAMTGKLKEARDAFDQGHYRASESTAQALTTQANAISSDIAHAAAKTKKRA